MCTQLACKRESEERHIQLHIITSPYGDCIKEESPFPFHFSDNSKTFPCLKHPAFHFLYRSSIASETEYRPHNGACASHGNPEPRRRGSRHNPLSYGIFCQERIYCRSRNDECQYGEKQNTDRIRQTVRDHRTEHFGERGFLTPRYVCASPHLPEARKDKVQGIATENRAAQSQKRRIYAETPQLYTPAQRTEYMGTNADSHGTQYPPIVHSMADNIHHVVEIDLFEHIADQQDCQRERQQPSEGIPQHCAHFSCFRFLVTHKMQI
ncbi:hypothetical protein IMSAG025_01830 [Muribaculaceae bacterium]|nr:hypothetical protein IMSAG025_01830 [Muribaculaceae bacterium]